MVSGESETYGHRRLALRAFLADGRAADELETLHLSSLGSDLFYRATEWLLIMRLAEVTNVDQSVFPGIHRGDCQHQLNTRQYNEGRTL